MKKDSSIYRKRQPELVEYRKAVLFVKNIPQKMLAFYIGERLSAVCAEINGYGQSRRLRKKIVDELGISYTDFWGCDDLLTPDRAAALRRRELLCAAGLKLKDVAVELNTTPGFISGVIGGHYTGGKAARKIAELAGVTFEEFWHEGEFTEGKQKRIESLSKREKFLNHQEREELEKRLTATRALWLMSRAGMTIAGAAAALGVSQRAVADAVLGDGADWVRVGIARLIGRAYFDVWNRKKPDLKVDE